MGCSSLLIEITSLNTVCLPQVNSSRYPPRVCGASLLGWEDREGSPISFLSSQRGAADSYSFMPNDLGIILGLPFVPISGHLPCGRQG